MQEVNRENLVPGKEYYVQCFAPSYAPPNKPIKMIGKFETLCNLYRELTCFTNFRTLEQRNDPNSGRCIQLALHWRFYEINVPTIQENMEKRVYKQVLSNIVKDEYFEPIEVL
jgi:hypothetical protein